MNTLALAIFACLAVLAAARPHDDGQWHGDGHWGGWDDGQWHGDGHWGGGDDGQWHGDGHWDGGWDDGSWDDGHWGGGHADVVVGHGATIVGPSAHGYGWGHGWAGAHLGGHGHGVVVGGPHTVPATIVGPSGKVHADGLYGIGHGHHGHHW